MTAWNTNAITRELEGAGRGYELALTALSDAAVYAEGAAAKMAAGGLDGVARGIEAIKGRIEAGHVEVREVAGQLGPLVAAVDGIIDETTPEQVITTLTPVVDDIAAMTTTTIRAANLTLAGVETLIRRNLAGGQPEHLLYRVGRARSILMAVRQRLDKAKSAADTVLAAARVAGRDESGGMAGGGSGNVPPDNGSSGASGGPDDVPEPVGANVDAPSYVRDAAGELPVRESPAAKTTGIAFDRAGRRLTAEPIWSGEDGPAAGAPGLRRDDPVYPWHQLNAALTHVEGHVAALMRAPDGPREVVLVLNNPPCTKRMGCHRLLPGMIPEGSQVHVYLARPAGSAQFLRTYTGHGRGVSR